MGTSNWQNIPFCVDALMKIAPQRVLDVGVGFGRWGMIIREFCDVWYGRILRDQWSVYIEGIEGYEKNISDYHNAFYNVVKIGDATKIIPSLQNDWDVVIFGDVLEHFERQAAEKLLNWCLAHSKYVLVNIPLGSDWQQGEMYENPFEIHKSEWIEDDFEKYYLRRKGLFADYIGRLFGSFILSKDDPKGLHESLFSLGSRIMNRESGNSIKSEIIYLRALQLRNEHLTEELNLIRGSRSYRVLEYLKAIPLIKFLIILLNYIRPKSSNPPILGKESAIPPTSQSNQHLIRKARKNQIPSSTNANNIPAIRSTEDQAWLIKQRENPKPLSINNPEWRGILASASEMFDSIYTISDDLDEGKALYYAELFRDAKPPSIVIQGFPISYYYLVKMIRKTTPDLPIFVIWHGNLLHNKEDYAWESFKLIKALHEEGDIIKIGFIKKGMTEIMSPQGIRSFFIMNFISRIPDAPSNVTQGCSNIGIWAEPDWGWKKLPYSMIASLKLIPNSIGHIHNTSPRAKEFGSMLKIKGEYYYDFLSRTQVIGEMSKMHLNMYVTLTECAPMMPLESLSVGSPCLIGPTSHYFLDHEYLHKRLVVPYPDNALTIAENANRALEEREQIIKAYREYAPGYNQRAREALANFLEFPIEKL